MSSLLVGLGLLALSVPLVVALMRANELFFLRWDGEALHKRRGRIPVRLFNDIADVLGPRKGPRAPADVTVRGVVEDQRPRLYVEGELTDAQRQRLRNVVGEWPVARIRAAPR